MHDIRYHALIAIMCASLSTMKFKNAIKKRKLYQYFVKV